MAGNMIGRVFNNRYQITERIGIGGMAEVYRAQDNVLGRLVALKTMLPQYAEDANFTQRFKQEAAAAANLQNPYIVNVYDWGQDDGTYYIVMEYVRGSDLKTAINERGAINQRKVAEIGSQVCQALSAAHRLDIIHRDIKPQNIMVQPDGNVKVMDFGIARAKNSVMTQTSSVLGTAHYISPEQAQGKELTATSDIYSLGIVMYEAATGQLPFDGPDAVSVAMQQVNDYPLAPSQINPDIDPDLEAIILKAMEKNPYDRFATASDMKLALNDYLAGRPISFGGVAGAQTAVMAGMGAGAVMAGAGVVNDGTAVMPQVGNGMSSTPQGGSSYRANNDNDKGKNTKRTVGIVIGVIVALILVAVAVYAVSGGFATGEETPEVTGLTVAEATTEIEKAGFKVGTTTEVFDDKVEAGRVVSTDPKGGAKREKGSAINLSVSKGTEMVTVPDLRNMTADEAKTALRNAGLKHEAGTAQYSSEIERDRVLSQNPAAQTQVAKNSTVTYVLSLGTEIVSVPNVVNYTESDAIATIQAHGFQAKVDRQYSSTVQSGLVISQDPTSSGKLDLGGTITIIVSQGAEPKPDHTVSASAGSGGSISPTGANTVKDGESLTFTITANTGYVITDVLVDGASQGAVSSYTFSNVTGDHTISVTFEKKDSPTPTPTPTPTQTGSGN